MKQNYINHIAILLDGSGSMASLKEEVIKVFDTQIKNLAERSKEMGQETRVTVYRFNNTVECLAYDLDVLRLPNISAEYETTGGTALIDATLKCISDLEKTATLYGDHSFLILCLTDGEENQSYNASSKLANAIKTLPDNWTLGVFVPSVMGVAEAKKFGFPTNNIQQWNTDVKGMREVGKVITQVTDNYMMARSRGVRGTKSLFNLDTTTLKTNIVSNVLDELKSSEYMLLPVHKESVIKPFVESWTQEAYRPGSAYYQLTKPEMIQAYKQICVQNKRNGKLYTGAKARNLLGLPDYEVKVNPSQYTEFDLFIQSTSLNRKLVGGTKLVVLK